MAEITAKLVNDLRAKTGLGMMECKKALSECAGDVEKAVEYFRKKGVKTSVTERAANEGRAMAVAGPDGKTAAAVEVKCNTDFAAKVDPVTRVLEGRRASIERRLGASGFPPSSRISSTPIVPSCVPALI